MHTRIKTKKTILYVITTVPLFYIYAFFAISAISANALEKYVSVDSTKAVQINADAPQVYDALGKKMRSTTLSSALTFYNDKEMSRWLMKI